MKTHPEICKEFDLAAERLEGYDIKLKIDDEFNLQLAGTTIHLTDRVEGLTSFLAALDRARAS